MTDFNKILDKAKELEQKMKESQENIKKIRVEGVSGSNSVKVILDGQGELQKVEISDDLDDTVDYVKIIEIVKEEMSIRSSMIEHPAARIADKILLQKYVIDVQVEVEKLNVPIAESFNKISVTVERKKNNY